MRGASRARQEEGKPRLAFLFVFSGAGQGELGSVSDGARGAAIPDDCLLCRRMAVWRGNGILVEPGQGRSGTRAQSACRRQKNYAVRIGKRGEGKVRTSGLGEQESRLGADLWRPGSGNGPSAEGQSMRRGRKGAGNDRDASIREGRQRACRRAMGTKKALAVSCKGEIWWAIRDSNPEPTD